MAGMLCGVAVKYDDVVHDTAETLKASKGLVHMAVVVLGD